MSKVDRHHNEENPPFCLQSINIFRCRQWNEKIEKYVRILIFKIMIFTYFSIFSFHWRHLNILTDRKANGGFTSLWCLSTFDNSCLLNFQIFFSSEIYKYIGFLSFFISLAPPENIYRFPKKCRSFFIVMWENFWQLLPIAFQELPL